MNGIDFETATRPANGPRTASTAAFARNAPRVVVSLLVVVVLAGGAFYAARISEGAPRVVYTASLEEVAAESEDSLKVDINAADVEELDELPEVGPATAESIIAFRNANGSFRSVDELEEVPGIGPTTIEKIAPFAEV